MARDEDPDRSPPGLRELRDLRATESDEPAGPPRPAPSAPPGQAEDRPEYNVYRARPGLLRRGKGGLEDLRGPRPGQAPKPARRRFRLTPWRVVKYAVLALFGWLALSLVLFLVSATLQRDEVSDAAASALDSAGPTLTSANTILVLGSDARKTKKTREPGSGGQSARSDSIMLMRIGGGANQRLSIPRDTVVDIPGHGRNKINASTALGGTALTIRTIKDYLGIEVNHVIEVDFANFPALIDALGGIDYSGGCVISRINGGFENGGYTLRLKSGTTHIDGDQALALARTRKNECNPRESDLSRARRQQKILSAMKDRATSPVTFLRLPLVSWAAPRTLRTDLGGPGLLGLFASLASNKTPQTRILRPSQDVTLPDGGQGLLVDDAERRRAVDRFLGRR